MKRALTALTFILCAIILKAQDTTELVIGFYNVENLFHPSDDSLKNDDAFTPTGLYHWTYGKYTRKINNIGKVLLALNGWEPPDIMGLAEVECAAVLKKLCHESPLKQYGYRYVHHDSPDARGVDVAPMHSVWASTNQMCVSLCTATFPRARKPISRKPDEPDATDNVHMPFCFIRPATSVP